MADYVPPGPEAAEEIRGMEAELEAQRRRLEEEEADQLKQVLSDASEPTSARQIAFEQLVLRFQPSPEFREILHDLLEGLVDDPDAEIAEMALNHCPLSDERVVGKVRKLLDAANERTRAAAAIALARIKHESVVPVLRDWFTSEGESTRNVAIEGLLRLDTPEARQMLEAAYEEGGRSENDRSVLAVALLRLGDTRGLAFLEAIARRRTGAWSVMAASWIYGHQREKGVQLMLEILDHGDLEAKQRMVNQIWNYARIPRAFEAEGFHEARSWVQRQLGSPQK